jgi:hypothetical protein
MARCLSDDNSHRSVGLIMKKLTFVIAVVVFISATSCLQAGETILYGALQKPGKIENSSDTVIPDNLLEGQFGSTYGIRFGGGKVVGYEENISYSPHFGKRRIKAFQMDSNLVIQGKTRVTPYATVGLGFIKTWGQAKPTDPDPIKNAAQTFSFGKKFDINYGGGLKIRKLAGSWGLNLDFRRYVVYGVHGNTLGFYQVSLGAIITW